MSDCALPTTTIRRPPIFNVFTPLSAASSPILRSLRRSCVAYLLG
ncbi:hypothetical protein [Lysobacter gummosus]